MNYRSGKPATQIRFASVIGKVASGLVIGVLLVGCGVVPQHPPALGPVPTGSPTESVESSQSSKQQSPDGFSSAQRLAVRVRNVGCAMLSTGSGFALDEHTLVTNKHVVEDSTELQLETYDGHDIAVDASSAANFADLALVSTIDPLPETAPIAKNDPEVGTTITIAGYPNGGALRVSEGEVLSIEDDPLGVNLGDVYYTSAQVEPGSSGSAALNEAGEIIGVIYAKSGSGSLFVPVSTLHEMLDEDSATALETTC